MKILVFTEGTIIMHKSAFGLTREQIVEQSKNNDESITDYRNYILVGDPVTKLESWKKRGAKIYYLTSRTVLGEVEDISYVLKKYNFPDNQNLLYRKNGEQYKDVAEKLIPDILIEDDCESIGGVKEMTYTNIKEDLKGKIKSVVIKEFSGVDDLPEDLNLYFGIQPEN